jgi:hypothetical protein
MKSLCRIKIIEGERSGVVEKFSGISMSKEITHRQVNPEVAEKFTYVPFEILDLANTETLPKDYFTVGVVVEVTPPSTARNGKVFMTLKFSNLVKYDMSKLRKNVLENL